MFDYRFLTSIPFRKQSIIIAYIVKSIKNQKGQLRQTDLLMRHDWPGNVRELQNVLERAVIMARGDIITPEEFPNTLADLDPEFEDTKVDFTPGRSLKEIEKEMVIRTLEDTGDNRIHTAKILGISRRTLQLKLKDYDTK